MLDHHIQRSIVYHLAFAPSIRFSELKPDDIDSKLFTYHLKKTIVAGLVIKNTDGTYSLTAEGRRVGKGALKKQNRLINRAYSILLLAIRRSDGAWLLYRRPTHPLIGLTGFMQAQPIASADITETATNECREQTGLIGTFSVHGHGYFRIYHDGTLESFIHFTLLTCDDIKGELVHGSKKTDFYWDAAPDFQSQEMLPTMETLRYMLGQPVGIFVDKKFNL